MHVKHADYTLVGLYNVERAEVMGRIRKYENEMNKMQSIDHSPETSSSETRWKIAKIQKFSSPFTATHAAMFPPRRPIDLYLSMIMT